MDSSNLSGDENFAFAFNNARFSDRLLRIEITGGGGGGGEVSWSSDRKRRRVDFNEETHGDEDDYEFSSPLLLRVKELHISFLILAAKSPVFYKLFSNGVRESEQKDVTLNVDASEEAAVMELLNFMYSNSLSVTTAPALLDVLMAADKFQVASCMKYCSSLLLNMPMTVYFALLLLDLPSSMQEADSVKPLINTARQFIASHYKDITKFPAEEVMALPLVGIEAILESDHIQVPSEDLVYGIVLKWTKTHYSDLKERQEILGSRLAGYIRFQHMTCQKLKEVLTSNDFRPSLAKFLVLQALFHKAEPTNRKSSLAATKRAYKCKPVQIVEFAVPRQQCVVYFDLKHEECAELYPSDHLSSEVFYFLGQGFFLHAACNMDSFGLFLGTQANGSASLTLDCVFSARSKSTDEFVRKHRAIYKFNGGTPIGTRKLFAIPWESFIAKDCPYFINDVLYIRAELSICV